MKVHQIREPGATLDDVLRTGPFDRALHLAIKARGLSLERIHARLRSQGLKISVASLSYWQRGRSRPERSQSLRAVQALEDILELPPDSLIGLLGPRRPDHVPGSLTYRDICPVHVGLDGLLEQIQNPVDGQLETLSHHERVTIGSARGERSARSRIVFRALRDRVDRHVAIHHNENGPPSDGFTSEFCRVGRVRVLADVGLTAVELIFDHPLTEGETYVVEYEFSCAPGQPEATRYVRGFRFPTREYLLQIHFDDTVEPKRCYQIRQPDLSATTTDLQELRLDQWNSVHLMELALHPGVHGIRWEWN